MVKNIGYRSIARVLESWELARQKYGSVEELGTEILFHLFRAEPESKTVFGFKPNQAIENHPLLRMGVLVHGTRIVDMLDGVLMLLGPDTELLEEILSQQGKRHERHGVKKEYFSLLGDAVRGAISEILGDKFTDEHDAAWRELFVELSAEIMKSME